MRYGLSTDEIYNMHLWEFNLFIEAQRNKLKEKEEDIIKKAYYTAYFSNAKKTKPLNYYLENIERAFTGEGKNKEDEKAKIEYAKMKFKEYEKIKRKEGVDGKRI